jgi:hypothetical protein
LKFLFAKKNQREFLNLLGFVFAMFIVSYVLPEKAAIVYTHTNRFLFLKLLLYGGVLLGFATEISHFLQFLYSRNSKPWHSVRRQFLYVNFIGSLSAQGT